MYFWNSRPSGFSRVYSNSCYSCLFEREIIKIGQSLYKMYSNNIVNFQESTTILNARTKNVWKLIVCTSFMFKYMCVRERVRAHTYLSIYSYIVIYRKIHMYLYGLLDIYTYVRIHTCLSHTHTHTYIYVCVCVWERERERERKKERERESILRTIR